MQKLILLRGLPGAGKTTYAQKYLCPQRFQLVEADDYFYFGPENNYIFDKSGLMYAHDACRTRTNMLLHLGYDVVVANTFTTISEMEWYIECAKNKAFLIVAHIKPATLYRSIHNVPAYTIDNMRNRWQPFAGETIYDTFT